MPRIEEAIQNTLKQNENRKTWHEADTPEHLAHLLQDEVTELIEGIDEAYITGDVFTVASEVGDVLYLAVRLCDMLGLKPEDVLDMKNKRNAKKYDDEICNNGYTAQEIPAIARKAWEGLGGDVAFSHIYLNYLADYGD